jgi:hypothetical protein
MISTIKMLSISLSMPDAGVGHNKRPSPLTFPLLPPVFINAMDLSTLLIAPRRADAVTG